MLRGRTQVNKILKFWEGGDKMTKPNIAKVKKTSPQRYALKVDKIISILFQMKPLCETSEKKAFVYGELEVCLKHAKELESTV